MSVNWCGIICGAPLTGARLVAERGSHGLGADFGRDGDCCDGVDGGFCVAGNAEVGVMAGWCEYCGQPSDGFGHTTLNPCECTRSVPKSGTAIIDPLRLTPAPANVGESSFWPTPAWVTEALLEHDGPPDGWIVEPSAGEGAIVDALEVAGYPVSAVERRVTGIMEHNRRLVTYGDWLTMWPQTLFRHKQPPPFSIVGNPPWDPAPVMLAHVEHCLNVGAEYVALLLPLRFLESKIRLAFNQANPVNALYVFAERIKFGTDGGGKQPCGWFVYKKGCTAQKIEVIG